MEEEVSFDLVMQNLVLKRKKNQRQRPCGNSSSSEDDIVDGRPVNATTMSPSFVEEEEEEHQAAKCLMLLSQDKYQTELNSLRLSEQAEILSRTKNSWLEKKVYIGGLYECKTCYRTFHSFQALGGHRTSHKKMKIKTEDLIPQKLVAKPSSDHQSYVLIPSIAQHLGTSRTLPKVRVHECLICSAVFASGQALGGHMRRHRVALAINSALEGETMNRTETTKSDGVTLTLLSPATEEAGNETSRSNNDFQCLDLNLPVTSDDEIEESQLCFGSKQPMEDSGLVFSSPALVDCHY